MRFDIRRFIRTADSALRIGKTDPEVWEDAAQFGQWAVEKGNPGQPRSEEAEAFVGSFLLLEFLEKNSPARYDPRLFTSELAAVTVGFCHPVIQAMYTIDLLEHESDEQRVWQQVDTWTGDGLTHEQSFVQSIGKAAPVLRPFFRLCGSMRLRHPLLRQALSGSPIIERIMASGRAHHGDKVRLEDYLEIRLNFNRWENTHLVSLSDQLAGRSADRTLSHLLRSSTHSELDEVPAQESYKSAMVRLISAVRAVNAGEFSTLKAVMESTHYFTGESRSRWLGAIAERCTKDAPSLHAFGKSLLNLKFKNKQRMPQGDWSLGQEARRSLEAWYSSQGKRISESVKMFRRWIRKTGQHAEILNDDNRVPEIRAAMGALTVPLFSVKQHASWIDAASNDLFPYELAIAAWLSKHSLLRDAVEVRDVQCRARQAWREIQPDRIELKRT